MAANIESFPFKLQKHVDNLYENLPRQLAFQAKTVEEFAFWQQALRKKVAELLGISIYEAEGLMKDHHVDAPYALEDYQRDRETLERLLNP